MAKHGKKYTAAAAKVDIDKTYSAREALALAKE
ncbi:MAG: 50S ribosomal protein L1, partial [Chloroflexi bacterium]|nr:50S ribosomal protein L1 [Chloroflexota bacterium]